MACGECLQEILQTAARVSHPVSRLDPVTTQAFSQSRERAVDKAITRRDACGARWPQLTAGASQPESEVESWLDNVPAMDEEHRDVAVACNDCVDALSNHLEQPRRTLDYLRDAVAVEPVAIHRNVDQRRRAESRRKSARDVGRVQIVARGFERGARARLGAPAVRRNQQQR